MDAPVASEVSSRRFDTIQGLRLIAALMVVIVHSTFYAHERLDPTFSLYELGANGVRLFFVISGFVMIVSSDRFIAHKDGWKAFGLKRLIRIVPMYWIVTTFKLITLLAATSLVLHARFDGLYVLKSYFFIPAYNVDGEIRPLFGVGWTLIFEMFFYLLFTIALLLRMRVIVLSALVLIPLAVLSLFKTSEWPVGLVFFADPIVLDFLYGMIAASLMTRTMKAPSWLAASLVVLGLGYLFVPLDAVFGPGTRVPLLFDAAAFAVVYGAASLEEKIGHHVPKPVVFLGAASYSLYLIHPILSPIAPTLLYKLGVILPSLSVVLSVTLALIASAIVYRFIEKPITDFLSEIERKHFRFI